MSNAIVYDGVDGDGRTIVPRTSAGLPRVGASEWGHTESGFSLSQLSRVRWWIIGVTVLLTLASVPLIWLLHEPVYEATAVVHVSPVVSRIVYNTGDNGVVPFYDSYMNTQVSFIRSPAVLQRVLDRADVSKTQWYRTPPQSFFLARDLTPMERMKTALAVTPWRETELIKVSMTAKDPKEAKLIADAVVDAYKADTDEKYHKGDLRRFETLQEEQRSLQNEIAGLVAAKFNLAKGLGTTDPEELRSTLIAGLESLEAERARYQRELELSLWEMKRLETSEPKEVSRHYSADEEWRRLATLAEDARHHWEQAKQRYGTLHPILQQLEMTATHSADLVRARESQLDELESWSVPAGLASNSNALNAFPQNKEAVKHMAERLEQQITLLNDEIERQRTKVSQAGVIAQDIARYDEDIRHKRELYETVRTRLKELALESKAPARISVAAYAVEPSLPYRDRRILLSLLALGGALMGGTVVGYVRVSFDSTIREGSGIQHTVPIPVLGHLPILANSFTLGSETAGVLTERMRMIRTALLMEFDQKQVSLVVTSASVGAGKTTVSYLLAQSFAAVGKKTLLVEADLRHPSLSNRLAVTDPIGLFSLLTETAEVQRAVHNLGDRFDAIFAGKPPESFDHELLGGPVLTRLLQQWRHSYDVVILDTPPVFPVADSQILAGLVDATVFVIRMGHCHRAGVHEALTDLPARGARIVGAVIVGTRSSVEYGYYNGYGGYEVRGRQRTNERPVPAGALS